MVLQIAALLLFLVVLPYLNGAWIYLTFKGIRQSMAMKFLCGHITLWAAFQATYLFFIIFDNDFTHLVITYLIVAGTLTLIQLGLARIGLFEIRVNQGKRKNPWVIAGWLIVFILVGFQLVMSQRYMFSDGDDAYYVAISVITQSTDTMYMFQPYTGSTSELDIRHCWSSAPIYVAFLGRIANIHTTIIAHTVLPLILIPISYIIYGLIGRRLLGKRKEYLPLFMIFINVVILFGNATIYTNATFMLTRTWQGKSMLANIIIPTMFLALLLLYEYGDRLGIWILISITAVAAIFTSTMGMFLIPVLAAGGIVLIAIMKKNYRYIIHGVMSALPMAAFIGSWAIYYKILT